MSNTCNPRPLTPDRGTSTLASASSAQRWAVRPQPEAK